MATWRLHRWLLAAAVASVCAALAGCKGSGGAVGNEVRIGEYSSLSGTTSTFGHSTHNGVQLAVDEENKTGGVNGRRIKLLTEDTESKPDVARNVVTKLVTRDRVVAVLGEVASTRSLAAAPVCQQYKVPMISPSSTNPTLTGKGDYIFRVCFTDDFQAAVVAHFAHDQGYRRAAIFTDIKNDYSVAFGENFAKEFRKMGGTVVGNQSYQEGDQDFRSQLSTLAGLKPDAVLIPGYYNEVGTIARQAREMGFKVPLLGGDGWDSPLLVGKQGGAGDALEGCFFSNHYSPELPTPETKRFLDAYRAAYKEDPDALGALGYDAAKALIAAMRRAKTIDGPSIRNEIAATKDFPGVTGRVTIDAQRNARKGAVIVQIRGKSFKVFKTYTPEDIGQ